jgi:hypothetical protein
MFNRLKYSATSNIMRLTKTGEKPTANMKKLPMT